MRLVSVGRAGCSRIHPAARLMRALLLQRAEEYQEFPSPPPGSHSRRKLAGTARERLEKPEHRPRLQPRWDPPDAGYRDDKIKLDL